MLQSNMNWGMFRQCRRITERTTNRHPNNIMIQIMIRAQCKHSIYEKTRNSTTIVTKAAAGLPSFNGTCVPFELVNKYKDSWQSHLTRISPFLVCGKDVWGVLMKKVMYSRTEIVILNINLLVQIFFTFVTHTFPRCMLDRRNAGRQ